MTRRARKAFNAWDHKSRLKALGIHLGPARKTTDLGPGYGLARCPICGQWYISCPAWERCSACDVEIRKLSRGDDRR